MGLVILPITAVVSLFVVILIQFAAKTTIKTFASIYAKAIPPQLREPAVNVVTQLIGPVALLMLYVGIQQVAQITISVPFLMSSIDTLEEIKGLTKKQEQEVKAAKARAVIARQTIIRTSIFVMVAGLYTTFTVSRNARSLVNDAIASSKNIAGELQNLA